MSSEFKTALDLLPPRKKSEIETLENSKHLSKVHLLKNRDHSKIPQKIAFYSDYPSASQVLEKFSVITEITEENVRNNGILSSDNTLLYRQVINKIAIYLKDARMLLAKRSESWEMNGMVNCS